MAESAFPSGAFVISLDFELYWGVRDKKGLEEYRENILGARRAVPALLALFRRFEIHATWATVGFLFFRTREELLAAAPAARPLYQNPRLCPYGIISSIGPDEESDPLHYAPSLISMIREHPFQEIATHSFSHYYCLEPGQDRATFEADLRAAIDTAKREGIEISSVVFPRNQVNPAYLYSCARLGLKAYRGNLRRWMFSPGASWLKRLLRFADTYVALSGDNSFSVEAPAAPLNIPASRFLRQYSRRLACLERLRLRRIARDLSSAAQNGRVYHLWWHPHNFGVNLAENLAFLEDVLTHFDTLRKRWGMESLTMAECAARLTRAPEVNDAVPVVPIHS